MPICHPGCNRYAFGLILWELLASRVSVDAALHSSSGSSGSHHGHHGVDGAVAHTRNPLGVISALLNKSLGVRVGSLLGL